jgi:hypothetical protein
VGARAVDPTKCSDSGVRQAFDADGLVDYGAAVFNRQVRKTTNDVPGNAAEID